jgi:peptide/nickel transport system permease protein
MLPRFMPGNPIDAMLAQMSFLGASTPEGEKIAEAYKKEFGLDKDLLTQYIAYLRQLFAGKLGLSIMAYPTEVEVLIARALPWTIGLLLTTTLIAWTLGNVLGAFVGWSGKRKLNSALVVISLCLHQIPYYLLGLILVFAFAYILPIFPTGGGYDFRLSPGFDPKFVVSVIRHSTLPALSIVLVAVGGWMIGMRSLIVSILGEDYLLFAEAKGLKKNVIMMKYAFRNALLPQVTGLVLSLGFLVNGALLTEQIFAYPGMGSLFVNAFNYRDYNVMQAVFLLSTLGVLGACFLLDIMIYPLVDPRIRRGG